MAKSHMKRSSWNKNDELYTPKILVIPILKYLKNNSVIWCPFDTINSEFVIEFLKEGHKVIFSHICDGKDFFKYEPTEHYDYIISNPPFSKKIEVLERLYKLDKPFAMLLGIPILNYQVIGDFFISKNSDIQLLIFNKKVSFDLNTSMFNTSYFCRNILPKDIIFESLPHNNSGKTNKDKEISNMEKDRGIIMEAFESRKEGK